MAAPGSIVVIMPVRNGMPLIEESLDSIRAQNYSPLEIAIVDDGSSDGTREYVGTLNGFCSHVLDSGGVGPSRARNAAVRATSSEFVAFLDADDLWPEDALACLAQALKGSPAADFAQGLIQNFRTMPDTGRKEFFTKPYRFLNLGACLWRREAFEAIGMLNETMMLCEDLDLLMRCWEKDVQKAEVDRVVLHYRRHERNMTRGLKGAELGTVRAFKERIERVRKGLFDPAAARRYDVLGYIGQPPMSQDPVA